jgi:peptide/nickel transport system permease protein
VPGLGRAMITAVTERDIMVIQNLVFLYSMVFVVLNILVDIAYAVFDPRIQYH